MHKIKSWVWDIALTLVFAAVMAFFLQAFVMEARLVPTGSMLPTIQIQDRVLVNKLVYLFRQPRPGEIIVFEAPLGEERKEDYIKRVIAVAGDEVLVKNKLVYVNNIPIEEKYLLEEPNYDFGPVVVPKYCLFVMGDNRNRSYDSHLWVPNWLEIKKVKGKAFMVYWPRIYLLK